MIPQICTRRERALWTGFVCLAFIAITCAYPLSDISVPVKRSFCSRNMPCKWAVCPWSRRPSLVPDEKMCILIRNEACRCPTATFCDLAHNEMDPLAASGAPFVKYEYRCHNPNNLDYYPLAKRLINEIDM